MAIPGRSWPVTAVSGHSPHDLENSPQWFLQNLKQVNSIKFSSSKVKHTNFPFYQPTNQGPLHKKSFFMFNFFPTKINQIELKSFCHIFTNIAKSYDSNKQEKHAYFLMQGRHFTLGIVWRLVVTGPWLASLSDLHNLPTPVSYLTVPTNLGPFHPPLLLTRLPSQGSLPYSRPCPRLLISTWYFWALDSCFLPSSTCTAVVSTLASILSVIKVLRLLRGVKITHNAILPQQKY